MLFQSWSQFQAWAVLILAMVLGINILIMLSGSQLLPLEGIVIGAVLGSLCSLFMVLPAEFELGNCSIHLFELVKSELQALGYVQRDGKSDCVIYQQNLPRLLRWEEGNFLIKQSGTNVIFNGAFIIVWKIRRSLLTVSTLEKAEPL
ncbi:hypothetical protein ACFPAH_02665 [Massilia sp. GCM10023247]